MDLERTSDKKARAPRGGPPRIALVGAGHVNATLLHRIRDWRERGWEVDFIAPEAFSYSGMASGVLAGEFGYDENVVDLSARAKQLGATCVKDRLAGIRSDPRELLLESSGSRPFDAACVNLGSRVPQVGTEGSDDGWLFRSKPVCQLVALRRRLEADPSVSKIVVLGGGVAGVEIACCLTGTRRRLKRMIEIRLVAPAGLLETWSAKGRKIVQDCLEREGVEVLTGSRAASIDRAGARLADGRLVAADIVVSAIGIRPEVEPLQGLAKGSRGGIAVDGHLQSVSFPGVFCGGDMVDTAPLVDRVGVYAVREAKVIARNIEAFIEGRSLGSYRPGERYVQIVNLGNGSGLFRWGRFVAKGRWALLLKNAIDRHFVAGIRA